jgi:hypothetical protein
VFEGPEGSGAVRLSSPFCSTWETRRDVQSGLVMGRL